MKRSSGPLILLAAMGMACGGVEPAPPPLAPIPLPEGSVFTGSGSRLIGRFDQSEPGRARFAWSGSALEFAFNGGEARLGLQDSGENRFWIEVDGQGHVLTPKAGAFLYPVASGLATGPHQVRVTRITEAFLGESAFASDPQVQGALLPAPPTPSRRLLVIGDSITAGYGVEGTSQFEGFSPQTENQLLTYAAVAAKAVSADLHAMAWSGIGAYRSYGEATPAQPAMPQRFPRTLPGDAASTWDPADYQPAAVLVNLGTNDYWNGDPGAGYATAMQAFITNLATDYPNARLYLIVSPMLDTLQREAQRSVLKSIKASLLSVLDLGAIEMADGYGSDGHPNQITHARLGAALVEYLKSDLGY